MTSRAAELGATWAITIVGRRNPVFTKDSRANWAWLHDGERWRRPATVTLENRDTPARGGWYPAEAKSEIMLTVDGVEYVLTGELQARARPLTVVYSGTFMLTSYQ